MTDCLWLQVGQGGFGKVMQVRKINGGKSAGQGRIFALKAMSKKHISDCGEVNGVRTEARVLQKIRHPFIVRLHYAFQTEAKLYLVMDFINGGQIFYHLYRTCNLQLLVICRLMLTGCLRVQS